MHLIDKAAHIAPFFRIRHRRSIPILPLIINDDISWPEAARIEAAHHILIGLLSRLASLESAEPLGIEFLLAPAAVNRPKLEKREAEIAALCAQIHPHYLFNTLEAIKMNLLVKYNVDETVEISVYCSVCSSCSSAQYSSVSV